jgi:hypothetical protein
MILIASVGLKFLKEDRQRRTHGLAGIKISQVCLSLKIGIVVNKTNKSVLVRANPVSTSRPNYWHCVLLLSD